MRRLIAAGRDGARDDDASPGVRDEWRDGAPTITPTSWHEWEQRVDAP